MTDAPIPVVRCVYYVRPGAPSRAVASQLSCAAADPLLCAVASQLSCAAADPLLCAVASGRTPPARPSRRRPPHLCALVSEGFTYYARVAVPLALTESALTYRIATAHLRDGRRIETCVGCRAHVRVRGRSLVGLVMGILPEPDIDPARIQAIEELIDEAPVLGEATLVFLEDVARYYRQSVGQIAHISLPRDSLAFTDGYRLCATPERRARQAKALFALQDQLVEILATAPAPMAVHDLRVAAQEGRAQSDGRLTLKSVREALDQCRAAGLVEKLRVCKTRLAYSGARVSGKVVPPSKTNADRECSGQTDAQRVRVRPPPYRLNAQQLQASRQIISGLDRFGVFVVHGVTGSGKTDVYLRALAAALNRPPLESASPAGPPQVLVLVPEISLAPQWQQRLSEYIDVRPAITHYKVSNRVRARVWDEAVSGRVRVLIGTRSSVFMPFANLRLIVVDEEHSHLYKEAGQGNYHARDVAIWRAQRLDIPVVLGSATPSCTTWHNLSKNHFHLLSLPDRVEGIALPGVRLIDLRDQQVYSGFSKDLLDSMRRCLDASRQVMIYHNSRGYAPAVYCASCARVIPCRNCHLALHLHRNKNGPDSLWCHRCLARHVPAQLCPDCGGGQLTPVGVSTQQIEQIVQTKFPEFSCLRLDSDSMTSRADMDAALEQIRAGHAQILIGTQMLVKGHHFPGVGLVVALQPDVHLFSTDLYARERLLQDLVQVAGRSGRVQLGEVIIQTRHPHEELYKCVRAHDYLGGMTAILRERQEALMPPYRHLAIARFTDPVQERALERARRVAHAWRDRPGPGAQIHAPVVPIVAYAHRLYRVQAWLMSSNRRALGRAIDRLIAVCHSEKIPAWSVDVDPVSAE